MFRKLLLLAGVFLILTACQEESMKKQEKAESVPQVEVTPAASLPPLVEDGTDAPHIVTLKNGLRVLIKKDDRFPLVNVRLYVHAGSAYETPEIAGLSHLLEHMVFKGTEKRGVGQSALDIESIGGSLNAGTSFDYTVFYVEVPNDKWTDGLDVVTDMVFNAKIDPTELESEKKVVLEELERGEDTASSKVFKTLQGMIWPDTTYEWPIIGFRDTVSNISREQIKKYIADKYQPQSMLLAVVGDIDPDQVLAEAERTLGDLENTTPLTPVKTIPVPEVGTGPQVVKLTGEWNKVYMGAAFPIPNNGAPEITGLDLLTHLMGGDDTSRLYRKFKYEEQLVDDISMSMLPLERGGFLYVFATLDADKVDQFWKELTKELSTFDPNSFTDREIARAQLNLENSLFLSKETLTGLASKLAYLEFFEDGQESEDIYLYDLRHVTRRQMADLYAKYVRPERLSLAVLTPEDATVSEDALTASVTENWKGATQTKEAEQAAIASETEEIALPGGSKLALIPDTTLPYTALSLYWTGGDGLLTPETQGLASLVAKGLTRGTQSMTATEIQDFLSDHAASLGSNAGRNVFAIESKFPTRFTDKLLPMITETLTAPAFTETELERAEQDQIAGIKRNEDRPLGLAFRHLFPYLYKTGPYALLHQGTPEGVAAFTHKDVVDYWATQSKQPFTLAVCGQFDREAIEAFAKNIAQSLTAPGTEYNFATPEWGTERSVNMTLPGRKQSHIIMSFPVPGKTDLKTSAELETLKACLSGQSGLLFRDLRDKQGLAYTVTSMLWQSKNTGFIALYIGTSPDKVDESLAGFDTVLNDLQDNTLPEEELTRAKNILVGDYYQSHQSLISRSRQAATLMSRGFDRDYEEKLIEEAKQVTPDQLKELVSKYMTLDKAYVMTITP